MDDKAHCRAGEGQYLSLGGKAAWQMTLLCTCRLYAVLMRNLVVGLGEPPENRLIEIDAGGCFSCTTELDTKTA